MNVPTPLPMPAAPLRNLDVRGLSFAYGQTMAVSGVSLSAAPGERIAIVGPNGCGKSTLLKLMLGALEAQAGSMLLDGVPVKDRLALAQRVALVPQLAGQNEVGIGGGFTVRETVMMARYATHAAGAGALGRLVGIGFETDADLDVVNRAMWAMDVHHLAPRAMEALSGGERQRVLIARALAQETPVVLLDEPTSALDLHHQLELMAILEQLSLAGRLVVMVTHDLQLASRFATRVVLMNGGHVVTDGTPAEVLSPAMLEPVYRVRFSTGPSLVHDRLQQL